jgi:hypothetical protein
MRKLTSKMPSSVLNALATAIAAPIMLTSKTVYQLPGLGRRLPLASTMRRLAAGHFGETRTFVLNRLFGVANSAWGIHTIEKMMAQQWCGWELARGRGLAVAPQPVPQAIAVAMPRIAA